MSFLKEPAYQLNIKVNSNNSNVKEFYYNFTTHHEGDSGIDLYNFNQVECEFLKVSTVDFEISCEMIDLKSNNYVSYYLVPRSSISKTSFQLANSIGIIDAGYRGNIMAKIRCFSQSDYILRPGSYFQIVAPDLKPIKVSIVSDLKDTSRNDNGFGSTNDKFNNFISSA